MPLVFSSRANILVSALIKCFLSQSPSFKLLNSFWMLSLNFYRKSKTLLLQCPCFVLTSALLFLFWFLQICGCCRFWKMSLFVQSRKDFLLVPSKNWLSELFTVESMLKIAIILGENGFFMYFFVKKGLHLLHLIPNFLSLTIEKNC